MKSTEMIKELIEQEKKRQREFVTLIASENYASNDVMEAAGSVLTNKYAEGYPGARYYGGCEVVDVIEVEAQERLKKLFNVKYANVQPHSGSQANFAVFSALLKPGDRILGMSLSSGGHLTHGAKFNASGVNYESFAYEVDKETYKLDYDEIEKLAMEVKPNLIIAGASAYPREIDFDRFREIADKVGAYLHADIAHIAGPIAAGLHNTPIGKAHVVTSTTHKTLRGPRSGIIMTDDEEIYRKINKGIFPGTQGGPLSHIVAAKAVAFGEALETDFTSYQQEVLDNAKLMAERFQEKGFKVITGGTDNHLFLVDVMASINMNGKEAQDLLTKAHIILNMNSIPFDTLSTRTPSGIRIGTPAITTLGISKDDLIKLTDYMIDILKTKDENIIKETREFVINLLGKLWDSKGAEYEN